MRVQNGLLVQVEFGSNVAQPIYDGSKIVGVFINGTPLYMTVDTPDLVNGNATVYIRNASGNLVGTNKLNLTAQLKSGGGTLNQFFAQEREFNKASAQQFLAQSSVDLRESDIKSSAIYAELSGACQVCDTEKEYDYAFCETLGPIGVLAGGTLGAYACATGVGCPAGLSVGFAMALVGIGSQYGCKAAAIARWAACRATC
jgi:hypothetical protein